MSDFPEENMAELVRDLLRRDKGDPERERIIKQIRSRADMDAETMKSDKYMEAWGLNKADRERVKQMFRIQEIIEPTVKLGMVLAKDVAEGDVDEIEFAARLAEMLTQGCSQMADLFDTMLEEQTK